VSEREMSVEGRDRITVESIIHPGRTKTVDRAMYAPVRDALLGVLPDRAPGLTLDEARDAVLPLLPESLFPGGSKAGWYFKVVQLDLEAKGVIAREPVSPLRVHRVPAE
jgi:hypothetical protein